MSSILIRRVVLSVAAGLAIGALITEVPFFFLRETARAPMEVLLTIPAGTAELVSRGEQPPSIPASMKFVVGDTLVVNNEDSVDHKLGTLWIPANSSARLSLDEKENMAFDCSFQPDNVLGLEVYEPLTLSTRILGILSTGLPLSVLIALYSLVMPVKKKDDAVS
ncbi:MAG TPA: hypothetical protein VMJ90_05460 [Anaerolineales bacterium]|nr:hypothetical protein [Anaerolineales bacterium]